MFVQWIDSAVDQRWLYWVLVIECLLLSPPTLILILSQQMYNLRARWYKLILSLWIYQLGCIEIYLLQTEERLRRGETQGGRSHARREEIRIEKELLKRRLGCLKLAREVASLYVERQKLYHPTIYIDFPDTPHRVRGTTKERMC